MKPYTTKLQCFYFWRPETRSAGDFTHSLPGSCAIKFNMAGNVQFLDLTPSPGTVLQVVCNFNMLYIGCQYQVIKKVKKKSLKKKKADLPYLSFLQDEIGNTHIFFWPNLFH